eukprot:TRINITY_DN5195_c0_g1_i1.p1 TRINITY_DN5195_c0_g1~~TRINITY_DN5195_c0_g1_i1.p1  ORF type:complete len:156 (+),score=29.05 TRINITY_DN5195_c0_g1_i1:6-473(+)
MLPAGLLRRAVQPRMAFSSTSRVQDWFELQRDFYFEAGHCLVHHDGKCKRPHGHSYTLRLLLSGNQLQTSGPKTNMIVDFDDLERVVAPLLEDKLDHHNLNETLGTDSPSAEFISRYVYHQLKPQLEHLDAVTIFETTHASVTYRPNAPTRHPQK